MGPISAISDAVTCAFNSVLETKTFESVFRDALPFQLNWTMQLESKFEPLMVISNAALTEKHYSPWVKTRQDALDREMSKVL